MMQLDVSALYLETTLANEKLQGLHETIGFLSDKYDFRSGIAGRQMSFFPTGELDEVRKISSLHPSSPSFFFRTALRLTMQTKGTTNQSKAGEQDENPPSSWHWFEYGKD
jgi:hypothetical protein